jgi:hypothetical protein
MVNTLKRTLDWFKIARPEPTTKDFASQLGVHLEEVVEMLVELDCTSQDGRNLLANAKQSLHLLAEHIKTTDGEFHVEDDEAFLDSICDQIVTSSGVAAMCKYDLVGAMDNVNHSNFSKFDEEGRPIYNENKKVMKGPRYVKADLKPFLG